MSFMAAVGAPERPTSREAKSACPPAAAAHASQFLLSVTDTTWYRQRLTYR
jgi:hypothetical protein